MFNLPSLDYWAVTQMTLGEADKLISKLDDLIFEADTGQAKVTWDEYSSWKNQAETLMEALAKDIASRGEGPMKRSMEYVGTLGSRIVSPLSSRGTVN